MMKIPTPMSGNPIGPWRQYFAWLPRETFDGCWCWMRPMVRRRIQKHDHLDGGADFWWQYALLKDIE
jgi:hypothetical protein